MSRTYLCGRRFLARAAAAACCVCPVSQLAAQSVLQSPVTNTVPFSEPFFPTHVAVSADSSLFVADLATETLQAFDPNGFFRYAVPLPGAQASDFVPLLGMAIDLSGNLRTATADGVLTTFSRDGELLSSLQSDFMGGTAFALTRDDQPLITVDRTIFLVGNDGALSPFAELEEADPLVDLQVTPDGRTVVVDSAGRVSVFAPNGLLMNQFSTAVRTTGFRFEGSGTPTALAATNDAVSLTDSQLGVLRSFSYSGEEIGRAHGVPETRDLVIAPDGALLAVATRARSIERLGPERFAPDSTGLIRFFERPNFSYANEVVERAGINADPLAVESDAHTFLTPGAPGELVELDFQFIANTSGFDNVVIAYDVASVRADPLDDPLRFQIEAFRQALITIRQRDHELVARFGIVGDPVFLETLTVEAGTEIGFLHLPEFPARDFDRILKSLDDAQFIEALDGGFLLELVGQTFSQFANSVPAANLGRQDQFTFIFGEDTTTLLFEDTNLGQSFSDADFVDFVLQINARLVPAPEPTTSLLVCLAFVAPTWRCEPRGFSVRRDRGAE